MANSKTLIIGTEKVIKPSSSWWSLNDDVFVVSAYGNSQITEKTEYYVESCSIVNPQTGFINNPNPFGNTKYFEQDTLYDDIFRFRPTESYAAEFCNTFPSHNLGASEFAVALTAHISEQMGYNPWVIIHPDEKNLIEFCKTRSWTFTVLSNKKDKIPQHVQELINNIVSDKSGAETRLISSSEYS